MPTLGGDEQTILETGGIPEAPRDGSLLVTETNPQHEQQLYHYWPDNGKSRAYPVILPNVSLFMDGLFANRMLARNGLVESCGRMVGCSSLKLDGRFARHPIVSANRFTQAALSVQTGAGGRIGDLPLAARVARKSTAKITCPTSRRCIENRLQRQSACPPAPDAIAATVAARAPAQVAVRTFIVR